MNDGVQDKIEEKSDEVSKSVTSPKEHESTTNDTRIKTEVDFDTSVTIATIG